MISVLARRLAPVLIVVGASACATAGGVPSDASTTVLSFQDLDCSDCGDMMARSLIDVEGVYKTAFDKRKAELTVIADPDVDVLAVANKNRPAKEDWSLSLGAGKGQYKEWEAPPPNADVVEVAKDGKDVPDLAPHLAKDKVNIVDFSAKWCEPCRELDAYVLTTTLKARTDVAYRKLDIGDWDTPLAQRYMKSVKELPYVIVFDKSGKQVTTISGLDPKRLEDALDQAGSVAGAPAADAPSPDTKPADAKSEPAKPADANTPPSAR